MTTDERMAQGAESLLRYFPRVRCLRRAAKPRLVVLCPDAEKDLTGTEATATVPERRNQTTQ